MFPTCESPVLLHEQKDGKMEESFKKTKFFLLVIMSEPL